MMNNYIQKFNQAFHDFTHSFYGDDHRLALACRYALEGTGKRIRPTLVMLSHQLFSDQWQEALVPAISVEMIHTYSLVHDDLPSMDNDDLRRGRPTVHKAFDEATAILVGDALLSDAFSCLSGELRSFFSKFAYQSVSSDRNMVMVSELAKAIGSRGMVYGQALDIEATAKIHEHYSLAGLEKIHTYKTGKLLAASCALGAIAGGASAEDVLKLRTVGELFGLAFQINDDLLDEVEGTGKTPAKDKAANKFTYLSLMSREEASAKVSELSVQACTLLQPFGEKALTLQNWINRNAQRRI